MIKLGDKVKCKYTGLIGVAVGRTEFINGCIQYLVAPKATKVGILPDEIGIDETALEVIKPRRQKPKRKPAGGPNTMGRRTRRY